MRNRNTLEFLGIWERIHNPDFNSVEFDGFRMQAGLNSFTLTPKQWIERTNAKGLVSKSGRYGGTFALRYRCGQRGGSSVKESTSKRGINYLFSGIGAMVCLLYLGTSLRV